MVGPAWSGVESSAARSRCRLRGCAAAGRPHAARALGRPGEVLAADVGATGSGGRLLRTEVVEGCGSSKLLVPGPCKPDVREAVAAADFDLGCVGGSPKELPGPSSARLRLPGPGCSQVEGRLRVHVSRPSRSALFLLIYLGLTAGSGTVAALGLAAESHMGMPGQGRPAVCCQSPGPTM